MQTPDDQQFEAYLKRFHPIAAEPLPAFSVRGPAQRSLSVWMAAAAAIIVVGVVAAVIFHVRSNRVVVLNTAREIAFAEPHLPVEPLTIRSANAWLATAPSFKVAVDDLAFRSHPGQLPQDKQSVVALLSKEKIRL